MRVVLLQHVPFEGPGAIEDWAASAGHPLEIVRLDRGGPLPAAGDLDALVVMGGPMGVDEEEAFPWLRDEKRLVASAVEAGRRVLGICLGAQILAGVLGARVFASGQKEIGWHPIEWSKEGRALPLFRHMATSETVFHWHGDAFDLPRDAVLLASSAACRCQGFALRGGQLVGLQFHLEPRPADIATLIGTGRQELAAGGPYVQRAEEILQVAPARCAHLEPLLRCFLDAWASAREA